MEKLKDIKLQSAKIEIHYTGTDTNTGDRRSMTEIIEPAPAWVALLCRYLEDHKANGVDSQSARSISLQGSFGDFPGVERQRWEPSANFNG
jgi:hypothetical protein